MIIDWILRCYPRASRQRYEFELRDIVEGERLSLGLVLDLLSGALDARLHPSLISSQGDIVLKPAGGLPHFANKYPELRSGHQAVLGILAWLGWTALAWQAIGALFFVVQLVGLVPYPLQDRDVAGSWSGLLWLQVFAGPLVGHVLLRRLAHAGARWRHGPATVRAWAVLIVTGTIAYSIGFLLLSILTVRSD